MSSFYDEVDVEDMAFDAAQARFTHPCPCGDVFFISLADLLAGEEVARCASCSLRLKVLVGDFDALEARERQLKTVAEAAPAAAAAAQAQEQAAAEPAAPDGGAAPVNDAADTVASSAAPADAAAAREPEPAADSLLGERFLDALCEVCAHGNCLDLHHARRVCGLSWRCANGVLTGRAGFLGQRAQLPPWGLVVERAANLVVRTAADSCEERYVLSLLAAGAPRRCERTGPRRRRGRAEPSLARGRRRTE